VTATAPDTRAATGSRWQVRVGLLLIAAGLAVVGWVCWQYFGTNVVAHHRQVEVVDDLEEGWAEGRSDVSAAGTTAGALVRIPRFGHDYRMPLLEGTSDEALSSGIGHFEGTAEPGDEGNVVLAAHRVTHGEPFSDMPSLRPGDKVIVETADTTYTYVMDTGGDDLEVSFDAEWVLAPLPDNPDPGGVEPAQGPGQRLITLTTCAELFHTDERLVAFGHLVGAEPRQVG
jgi:sortase A